MKILLFSLLAASGFALEYPLFREGMQIDEYHGIQVADPYRSLEDMASSETKEWIAAENALSSGYLQQIPELGEIRQLLESFCDYEKGSFFAKRGDRYFLSKQRFENQPIITTWDHFNKEPEVLLDPNEFSNEGTLSVTVKAPSETGEWFAYGLSKAGSDWLEIRIRNVETKEDLPERLYWAKFTKIAWLPDSSGFYYSRFDEPSDAFALLGRQKVYFHKLGSGQESDQLVYAVPSEGPCHVRPTVDEEGEYLILTLEKGYGLQTAIYFQKLGEKEIVPLFADYDAEYIYIGNQGNEFWFLTDRDAPMRKLIAVDLKGKTVRDMIDEKESLLESAAFVGGKFALNYLQDAANYLKIYSIEGVFEREIFLPSIGSAEILTSDSSDDEFFFAFFSFNTPPSIYGCKVFSGALRHCFQPRLPFSPDDFETRQVFYNSKDGTKIPIFLSYKKGVSFKEPKPVYLYGYGGFGVNVKPYFSLEHLAWMEMGGILAIPNLRGGNEYGKKWHEAGMLANKQNVFDDFISAAEWLVSQNITTTSRLAIGGASNGGLLVAACLNQRPDLFKAALPMVGVHDMLRYQRFSAGKFWVTEYGSAEDPKQFSFLIRYSPLHNVREMAYPPTLVLTADQDDRVVPTHSYKYAAALQKAQTAEHPILLRVVPSAGHGWGKPVSKQIEESAEKLAFLRAFLF